MDCLRCGKPVDTGKALCQECMVKGDTKIYVGQGKPVRRLSFHPLLVIVVLLAALWFVWPKGIKQFPNLRLPSTRSAGANIDPCAAKQRCLIAAVAPWCPACHASISFMNGLSKDLETQASLGFKIIVFNGERDEMWQMADRYTRGAFVDENGDFAAAVGSVGVPHWWLINKQGKVLDDFSGAFSDYGPETRKRFFDLYLPSQN